nr:hypothetical protein [Xanthomonas euvesicatoria]
MAVEVVNHVENRSPFLVEGFVFLEKPATASTQRAYPHHSIINTSRGSTPISRTVVKELQPSDPAWPPFAA